LTTITELEERKARLELERTVATLEAEVRAAQLAGRAVPEAWDFSGGYVDPREYLRDGSGLSDFGDLAGTANSRPQDRWRGDNAPFWRTESEHAAIRGTARVIATFDEVGIAALENLTNYIIGPGFEYEVDVAPGVAATDENRQYVAAANHFLDQFFDRAGWWADGEREAFANSRRDGEAYLVLWQDGLIPRFRLVDPSFVVAPDSPRQLEEYLGLSQGNHETLDWKYGHGSPWRDSGAVEWIFVSWYGDPLEWEAVEADRFVHLKLNVDRDVKRGLTDFFPVCQTLSNADKLLSNTVQGAAVQAAIAYIREHAQGVKHDGVEAFRNKIATDTRTDPTGIGGTVTRYARQIRPGTVIDTVAGAKFHAGPLGTQRGSNYIAILQAALRVVGVRFQQPEYMISGDASNNAYASTLAAEAPFTKSAEAKQTYYRKRYGDLAFKALRLGYYAGSFPLPPRVARKLLAINVTGPAIAVRDRKTDHEIRVGEHAAGVLSRETWAAEVGRSLEEEEARGARPQAAAQPTAGGPADA